LSRLGRIPDSLSRLQRYAVFSLLAPHSSMAATQTLREQGREGAGEAGIKSWPACCSTAGWAGGCAAVEPVAELLHEAVGALRAQVGASVKRR
jgi:hypothetical protein